MRVGGAEEESGAPLEQAGEQESRGAQVGGSGGRHSGAGRVPVTAALWSWLCRSRGLSGPEVLGVKSGKCWCRGSSV